jgi:hypothetical protein
VTEELVAMQVDREPLEEASHVEDAVASPLELGVLGFGQRAVEPLELLLAYRVSAVTLGLRHMDTIDDNPGPRHLLCDRPHETFVHICARALHRAPKHLGHRAQEGCHRLHLTVREHRIVLNERYFGRTLARYFAYYHHWRAHLALAMDRSDHRPVQPPECGRVIAVPEVGRTHHHYERRAA